MRPATTAIVTTEPTDGDQCLEDIVAARPAALRAELTSRYVGHASIHGIGLRMDAGRPVIYVYLDREYPEQQSVLQALQADARPYDVMVVREPRPTAKKA